MAETITLYNHTEIDQHAYTEDGKRYTLAPYQIQPLPSDIAELFLRQRAKFVQRYAAMSLPTVPGEDEVWMANNTGNPFLPAKIKVKYFDKQTNEEKTTEIDNPLRKAKPLEHVLSSQQMVVDSEQGSFKESRSYPGKPVRVPPYTRFKCSRSISEWLSRRDYQQEDLLKNSLVFCREPSAWEPNETWQLDEIQVFAELLDEQTQWGKFVKNKGDEREQKLSLLNALFFRLIDDRFLAPPKTYYEKVLRDRRQTLESGNAKPEAKTPKSGQNPAAGVAAGM